MDWQFNAAFPVRFWSPSSPAKYDQVVVVNWLNIEVDMKAETKMPHLTELSHVTQKDLLA